jgi:hypothetical protein
MLGRKQTKRRRRGLTSEKTDELIEEAGERELNYESVYGYLVMVRRGRWGRLQECSISGD